jgi:ribosome-binding factor A
MVLGGELCDPVLNGLIVSEVIPAPNASHLLVRLTPAVRDENLDVTEAVARLILASGQLRTAVAQAITRKRAPRLSFQISPGPLDGGVDDKR